MSSYTKIINKKGVRGGTPSRYGDMNDLNTIEKEYIIRVLKAEKERVEAWLKDNAQTFEAFFVVNETLPAIKNIINKLS